MGSFLGRVSGIPLGSFRIGHVTQQTSSASTGKQLLLTIGAFTDSPC